MQNQDSLTILCCAPNKSAEMQNQQDSRPFSNQKAERKRRKKHRNRHKKRTVIANLKQQHPERQWKLPLSRKQVLLREEQEKEQLIKRLKRKQRRQLKQQQRQELRQQQIFPEGSRWQLKKICTETGELLETRFLSKIDIYYSFLLFDQECIAWGDVEGVDKFTNCVVIRRKERREEGPIKFLFFPDEKRRPARVLRRFCARINTAFQVYRKDDEVNCFVVE